LLSCVNLAERPRHTPWFHVEVRVLGIFIKNGIFDLDMSGGHGKDSEIGPSENEKALASLVSGAIVVAFNIVHSIFATIFRIMASII